MSLNDVANGEEQPEQKPDQPSISYLYLYEEGRDETDDWSDDATETMEQAYQACSNGGIVRSTFKKSGQYQNIHHAVAELVVGIAEVFEDGDFSRLLEFIGPDAEALAQYLDDNPDVLEELSERMQDTQATADD